MKQLLLFITICCLAITGCNDDRAHAARKNSHAYFWTTNPSAGNAHLYIDQKDKGVLPFIADASDGSPKTEVISKGLKLTLKEGEYAVEARDAQGNTITTGKVSIDLGTNDQQINSSWNNDHVKVHVVYAE